VITFGRLPAACFLPVGCCVGRLKTSELENDLVAEVEETTHDPLELHFRKMTEYPLLTKERELWLAERLERADIAITRVLLESVAGRRLLREIVEDLVSGELRVEDVARDPRDDDAGTFAKRLEVALARKKPGGLRLHPQVVVAVARELREEADENLEDAPLHATLRELDRERAVADEVTREFVQANLRIVVTFARRYRGMPLIDLIQEGNLGLLRAVDKFDHRRGLRFSTYAAWWIRHALGRALADQSKMIRLPVHLAGTLGRLRRAQDRFARDKGRLPTNKELSDVTGVPVDAIAKAFGVVAQPISLDAPVASSSGDPAELIDFVADQENKPADEAVSESQMKAATADLLSTVLDEREALVITLRFGIGGVPTRTLEEIGEKLAVSRERARQLEREALRKLRAASEKRQLESLLRV